MNEKQLDRRYFIMAFAVTFFIIAAATVIIMQALIPKVTASSSQSAQQSVYYPDNRDIMNVLFMGIEKKDAVSYTYILVSFNPVSGHISVVAIPPQTKITMDGKQAALHEAYSFGGYSMAAKVLEQSFGIRIDRYVRMKMDSFIQGAKLIGAIEYELTQDISYRDENGRAIELAKGVQLIDGQKAADIIRYQGFKGGELERAQITADLTAAIINEKISIASSPVAENLFKGIINLIDTNITAMDFEQRKNAAVFLAQQEYDPATNFPITGEYNYEGDQLTLSENTVGSLKKLFG